MNVMKKAWEIAKQGQSKFGGKVREYFAQALRMAWQIAKGMTNTLPALQGSEKQIAWATDIRQRLINECQENIKKYNNNIKEYAADQGRVERSKKLQEKYIFFMEKVVPVVTSAKEYIDVPSGFTVNFMSKQNILGNFFGHLKK